MQSWKKINGQQWLLATNALLEMLAPTPNDFKENYNVLSIDNIRAISSLNKIKQYANMDMFEQDIPTEMIKLCINNLNSNAITLEE